jgi:glutamine amidotransferase
MNITLVDYGLGNIQSIFNSFINIGIKIKVSSDYKEIKNSDKIILPGVGSFNYAIECMNKLNLVDTILEINHKKKAILGLCLGMQILFEDSEENSYTEGLSILKGNIKSLKKENVKVPNVGWRNLEINNKNKDVHILRNIKSTDSFYFIHSFYAKNISDNNITINSKYESILLPSIVLTENIVGIQFHPEKSGIKGLTILDNFSKI